MHYIFIFQWQNVLFFESIDFVGIYYWTPPRSHDTCGPILGLRFGNRGMNQPVVDLRTQRCYITSQNHGFAVDQRTLPDCSGYWGREALWHCHRKQERMERIWKDDVGHLNMQKEEEEEEEEEEDDDDDDHGVVLVFDWAPLYMARRYMFKNIHITKAHTHDIYIHTFS